MFEVWDITSGNMIDYADDFLDLAEHIAHWSWPLGHSGDEKDWYELASYNAETDTHTVFSRTRKYEDLISDIFSMIRENTYQAYDNISLSVLSEDFEKYEDYANAFPGESRNGKPIGDGTDLEHQRA